MLHSGEVIQIRDYVEIPVEHEIWDERAGRYFRSHERDLEEGLFPGVYQVSSSAYSRQRDSTVGYRVVLALARISPETQLILRVDNDRYVIHGAEAIKTLERATRSSVKDWRPEMGASNPPSDLSPGMGIRIWGTPYDFVPVHYTKVQIRQFERYNMGDGWNLRAGQYIVLDYDHNNSILTLGRAEWFHGEPARPIYEGEEFVIYGREEIKHFLENDKVVLYGRIAGKKKWRPGSDKDSLVDLGNPEITPAAMQALERAGKDPREFLELHGSGDWGLATKERVKSNEYVIKRGGEGYIVSLFMLSTGESIIVSSFPALGMTVLALTDEYTPPLAEIT